MPGTVLRSLDGDEKIFSIERGGWLYHAQDVFCGLFCFLKISLCRLRKRK